MQSIQVSNQYVNEANLMIGLRKDVLFFSKQPDLTFSSSLW